MFYVMKSFPEGFRQYESPVKSKCYDLHHIPLLFIAQARFGLDFIFTKKKERGSCFSPLLPSLLHMVPDMARNHDRFDR